MAQGRIALVAVRPFVDDLGDLHAQGEVFEVTPIRAAALTYRWPARFLPRGRGGEPDSPVPAARTERRRYGRRDMQAED